MVATFEAVMAAVRQLTPAEQAALVHCLEVDPSPTPQLAELDHISEYDTLAAAGAFSGGECLACLQTSTAHLATEAELLDAIEDIASEWDGEWEGEWKELMV